MGLSAYYQWYIEVSQKMQGLLGLQPKKSGFRIVPELPMTTTRVKGKITKCGELLHELFIDYKMYFFSREVKTFSNTEA